MEDEEKPQLKLRSYQFSVSVVKFIGRLKFNTTNKVLGDQLLKSATSISANVAEAQGSISRKEFIKFFQIAFKSAIETKHWLQLYIDATDEDPQVLIPLLQEAIELTNILGASLKKLKANPQS